MAFPITDPKSAGWQQLSENFDLRREDAQSFTNDLPVDPGLYLWTFAFAKGEFGLYLGRAKNVRKRIYNYAQAFQPHSPNDRKIFFAQQALREHFEELQFPLYWKPESEVTLVGTEKLTIQAMRPLLNEPGGYSHEHRSILEATYGDLYRNVISARLGEA